MYSKCTPLRTTNVGQMWSIWKCSKIATTILEDDNCSFLQDSIQAIWSSGSVLVAHKLSGLLACGIFPEQGSNLGALAGGVLIAGPQGESQLGSF